MDRRVFIKTVPLLLGAILTPGCGYVWRGQEGSLSEESVLGTGKKTLKLKAVEQSTLYPWLPYVIRSQIRDDITARGLAQWVDTGASDFTLTIRVNSFQIRSSGQYESQTQLFTATINMEFIVYNGSTNTVAWQSGPLFYSDNFENNNEEEAIREVLTMSIRRGVDLMQQRF